MLADSLHSTSDSSGAECSCSGDAPGCQRPELFDIDTRFPDSETCVRLEAHVSGADAFLFQSLLDPTAGCNVDQNYMAFLIGARALREQGARHATGVLPYLAYARQDKPTRFAREPTTARLMADLSISAGVDRIMVWDPHCGQVRGFYGALPVQMLDSLTLFLEEFGRFAGRDDVIAVAPDVGAAETATHFARALGVKSAIASKHRPQPEQVCISEIIGDFEGKRTAIVLDDVLSTGGTIQELVYKLVAEKGIEEVHLGVSHSLCTAQAGERLGELQARGNLREVVVTDSVPQTAAFGALPYVKIRSLSEPLCRAINRVHHCQSVSEVFYRP